MSVPLSPQLLTRPWAAGFPFLLPAAPALTLRSLAGLVGCRPSGFCCYPCKCLPKNTEIV